LYSLLKKTYTISIQIHELSYFYQQFNTIVKKVMQVDPNNRQTRWIVSYSDIRKKDDTTSEEFVYVMVYNG